MKFQTVPQNVLFRAACNLMCKCTLATATTDENGCCTYGLRDKDQNVTHLVSYTLYNEDVTRIVFVENDITWTAAERIEQ